MLSSQLTHTMDVATTAQYNGTVNATASIWNGTFHSANITHTTTVNASVSTGLITTIQTPSTARETVTPFPAESTTLWSPTVKHKASFQNPHPLKVSKNKIKNPTKTKHKDRDMVHGNKNMAERQMLQNSLLVMLAMMQENEYQNLTSGDSAHKPFSIGFPTQGRYVLIIALVIGVVLGALVVFRQKLGARAWYQSIASGKKGPKYKSRVLDYIYRPLQGDVRDDDYENTFVGVSVPLLQDVSKV